MTNHSSTNPFLNEFDFPCALCGKVVPILFGSIPGVSIVYADMTITSCCESPVCPRCSHGKEGHCRFCLGRPAQLRLLDGPEEAADYRYQIQNYVVKDCLHRIKCDIPFFGKSCDCLSVRHYLIAGESRIHGHDFSQMLRAAFQFQFVSPSSKFLSRYSNQRPSFGGLDSSISHDYGNVVFYGEFRKLTIMVGFLEVMHSRLVGDRHMNIYVYSMIKRIKSRILQIANDSIILPPAHI
jgi:hypothetical protein